MLTVLKRRCAKTNNNNIRKVKMIHPINTCWKCNEHDEHGCHVGRLIAQPCAMAINLQISGLCQACQKDLADAVEAVMVEFVKGM